MYVLYSYYGIIFTLYTIVRKNRDKRTKSKMNRVMKNLYTKFTRSRESRNGMMDLYYQFTKACESENKNQAMILLDKIQKKTDKTHDVYLFTCRARVDICTYKFEKAVSNIDIMMHELYIINN